MQITLVSSSDCFSDVLNRFEANFSFDWFEIKKEFIYLVEIVLMSNFLIKKYPIRELKAMADFLATAFHVVGLDTPKRNSKVSLADWIGEVLLFAREIAETSEVIMPTKSVADSVERSLGKNYWCPQCDVWMARGGFDEILGSDFQEQLCKVCGSEVCWEFDRGVFSHGANVGLNFKTIENSPVLPIQNEKISEANLGEAVSVCAEVLDDLSTPNFDILLLADDCSVKERVNQIPPYLLDGSGNLFKKTAGNAGFLTVYVQVVSRYLPNIVEEFGQLIELTTDDLTVYRVNIHGNPPPYVVHKRGVYKRMTWGVISLGSTIKYVQVISEHLSNISVVMTPQEIHTSLKNVLENLCKIDSSETFAQMLANDSFLIDDDDMGYLVHQVEQILAAVKVFAESNTNEKETSSTATAQDFASCATNFRFASVPNQARLSNSGRGVRKNRSR